LKISYNHKALLKKLLVNSRMLILLNEFATRRIAILKYHSIQDKPELYDDSIGLSIIQSTDAFKEQMRLLASRFNPVTLDDVFQFLMGVKTIKKNAVAITFDDGYADNFEIAAPILDNYGLRATFYVTVGSIASPNPPWFLRLRHAIWTTKKNKIVFPGSGNDFRIQNRQDKLKLMRFVSKRCASLAENSLESTVKEIEQTLEVEAFAPKSEIMMTWNQIKKLHESGHIIGSHTMHHPNVAFLSKDDLKWQLMQSKHILEKEIGAPIRHFSYPNPALSPQFTDETTAAVKESGYKTAVLSANGSVREGNEPLLLERLSVSDNKLDFLWNLECMLLGRKI